MSDDEVMITIVSGLLALITWSVTLIRLGTFPAPASAIAGKRAVSLAFPVSVALLFVVLRTMASHDVVNDARYLAMYSIMGAAWIGVIPRLMFAGISVRDDLLERGNTSAGLAVAGFIIGCGFCFAGGNIGDGPGWWVVIFSGLLATVTLSFFWWMLNGYTKVVDHITIDRDPAVGMRIAGYFIGTGLILGRAVAGDWQSAGLTVQDFFRHMWPALILTVIAIIFERRAQARFGKNVDMGIRGGLPAIGYMIGGLVGAAVTGPIQ